MFLELSSAFYLRSWLALVQMLGSDCDNSERWDSCGGWGGSQFGWVTEVDGFFNYVMVRLPRSDGSLFLSFSEHTIFVILNGHWLLKWVLVS